MKNGRVEEMENAEVKKKYDEPYAVFVVFSVRDIVVTSGDPSHGTGEGGRELPNG